MRIKIPCCLILLLFLSGCATNRSFEQQLFLLSDVQDVTRLTIASSEISLPSYEKLTYDIKWVGIPVGTLTASIKGIEKINGRDAYVLEAVFKTNKFCSAIYSVEDRYISYMDKEKLYTVRHEVYRREGKYKKDAVTDFDQANRKAYFRNLLDKTEKVFDIPEGVHDFLSAYYYFRFLPLKSGDKLRYTVSNNEKNYQVIVFVKSQASIKLGALGKKKALLIQPYALLKGEKIKEGSAQGYYSLEGNRPLLGAIVTAPVFTKVTAFLSKVESS
jgi:hypothetical protein